MPRFPFLRRTAAVCAALISLSAASSPAGAFGYAEVQAAAAALAEAPFAPPPEAPALLSGLGYDQYQSIRFRPAARLWQGEPGFFRVEFLPAGFIYRQTVELQLVEGDQVSPLTLGAEALDWSDLALAEAPPAEVPLAGFRLLYPLHQPEVQDEVLVFLGASYFRLLAREQAYGLSARGLALDTGLPEGEEFPFFRAFWLVRPAADAQQMTLYALLDSPSVTGGYQFTLAPGTRTALQVRATLFAREDIALLGLAPLTSMFLAGENSDRRDGDLRPEVHDSDGLLLATGAGEHLWRPLTNPAALRISSFLDRDPRGFGLLQRDRDLEHYLDLQARYHLRPSLWVQPEGDWGEGEVRLFEIPTAAEMHDNITAFWAPRQALRGGERREFAYRLVSFSEPGGFTVPGHAVSTRLGPAALPGTAPAGDNRRRVVVEFEGEELALLRDRQPVEPVVMLSAGELLDSRVEPLGEPRRWRLTIDFDPAGADDIEMRAFLRLYSQALTETWTYRWNP